MVARLVHSPHLHPSHPAGRHALLLGCALVGLLTACDGPSRAHSGLDGRGDAPEVGDLVQVDLAAAVFAPGDVGDVHDVTLAPPDGDAAEPPPPTHSPWISRDGVAYVMRGVNLANASKSSPDHLPPAELTDFVRLRDELGLDAVRLLVFWEAIEPTPGVYDDAYLASVRALVAAASEAGMHVLVDMHQDVYGRGFGHAGAPPWSCDAALYDAFVPPSDWFMGYFTPQVEACFDQLWSDPGTRAAFAAAWRRVAEELVDTPGVFAYDLFNEPFWGSAPVSGFDYSILPGFYTEVIDAIRTVDPRTAIAVEPSTFTNVGFPSEFALPPRDGLIYAPHVYPPAVEAGTGYGGNAEDLAGHIAMQERKAMRLGAPLMIGEFGVRRDVPGAAEYLRDFYDGLDAVMGSAFYWDGDRGGDGAYGIWTSTGEPAMQATQLARPYLAEVAGEPLGWRWETSSGVFVATWTQSVGAVAETVVVLPRLAFPAGARVWVDGVDVGERAEARFVITALADQPQPIERTVRAERL